MTNGLTATGGWSQLQVGKRHNLFPLPDIIAPVLN